MQSILGDLTEGLLAGLEGREGERIDVRHGPASAPGDVAALAQSSRGLLRGFRTIVVDGRLELAESDVAALAAAAAAGTRVVVTGPPLNAATTFPERHW